MLNNALPAYLAEEIVVDGEALGEQVAPETLNALVMDRAARYDTACVHAMVCDHCLIHEQVLESSVTSKALRPAVLLHCTREAPEG
jgi:hypothetical protein